MEMSDLLRAVIAALMTTGLLYVVVSGCRGQREPVLAADDPAVLNFLREMVRNDGWLSDTETDRWADELRAAERHGLASSGSAYNCQTWITAKGEAHLAGHQRIEA